MQPLEDLKAQVVDRQTEMREMLKQIAVLYEKLDVSPDDQCPLSTGRVCGIEELIKMENMEQVKEELCKLKKLMVANLGKIVEKSETELVILWNDCMVGDSSRKDFLDAACEDLEEEVHRIDQAIEEMEIYKEKNQEVLKMLKKFLNGCELAKDLRLRLLDPNRLFNSRGNAMVKEEADRRTVHTLPALKEELLEFARTREDLMVFDTCMSSLVEDKAQLFERIYESSLSSTVPSKTISNQHGRGAAFKANRSVQSSRLVRCQGRLVSSPGLRRINSRSTNRINKSKISSNRKSSLVRIGNEETPRARPGHSTTRPRFHMNFTEHKILVQDASTVEEHVFQENIPYNSTLLHRLASPLSSVPESSFEQERPKHNVTGLKMDQHNKVSISNEAQKNLSKTKEQGFRRKHRKSSSCSDLGMIRMNSGRVGTVASSEAGTAKEEFVISSLPRMQGSKLPVYQPVLVRAASTSNVFVR